MSCDNTFEIRKGDSLPVLRALLHDTEGNVPDLTGATAQFVVKDRNKTVVLQAAATVLGTPQEDALTGDDYNAEYAWGATDTDDLGVGTFRAEFEVTFPSGKPATFPTRQRDNIRVKVGEP